jgi:hypothetical protein
MMTPDLPDWPRPNHDPLAVAATGAPAELFYLVVGPPPPQPLQVSRRRHHLDRIETALTVTTHHRAEDPPWFDAWFHGPLGREIDGLFIDPDAVRAAQTLTVVRGQFPADAPDLNYLRNTLGVVSAIADTPGAVAVFDALAVNWWRLGDWREAFVDRSEFRIADHVFIAVTDDPRHHPGLWTHTRGMTKFGRPDLQIRHLPGEYRTSNPAIRASGSVLNGIATYLAHGATIRDGQSMYLPDTDATITFLHHDDPDTRKHFNNTSIEICDFDESTGLPRQGAEHLLARAARRERE